MSFENLLYIPDTCTWLNKSFISIFSWCVVFLYPHLRVPWEVFTFDNIKCIIISLVYKYFFMFLPLYITLGQPKVTKMSSCVFSSRVLIVFTFKYMTHVYLIFVCSVKYRSSYLFLCVESPPVEAETQLPKLPSSWVFFATPSFKSNVGVSSRHELSGVVLPCLLFTVKMLRECSYKDPSVCVCVLSCSVMSASLRPRGL